MVCIQNLNIRRLYFNMFSIKKYERKAKGGIFMFDKSKEKIKELGSKMSKKATKASMIPVNVHLALISNKGERDFKKIGGKKGY